MNQSNFLYGAVTGPMDSAQVQAFAMAREPMFAQLNQTLGIRLDPWQYRQLQSYFFNTETKNPTLGELRLLADLHARAPLSRLLTPGEIYTDSEVLMDTWADAMAGFQPQVLSSDTPPSLGQILSLPSIYLKRTGRSAPSSAPRVVSANGSAEMLSLGYSPTATVTTSHGAPRQIWCKKHRICEELQAPSPAIGDILLITRPASFEAIDAFLCDHPMATAIKSKVAVTNTSVTEAALSLCGDGGLSLDLNTLVPHGYHPTQSRVEQYLNTWEQDAPQNSAYLILRIAPQMQAPLYTTLSEHGFSPCVMGKVIKRAVLTVTDNSFTPVNLKPAAFQVLTAPLYRCVLGDPSPLGEALPESLEISQIKEITEAGCTVADSLMILTGDSTDGFTPAVQSVLALCCQFAAVGIDYSQIELSPVLYYGGDSHAPLLLSTVCGLYRAATELGISMSSPEILFKHSADEKEATMRLSLVAYSHRAALPAPTSLHSPDNIPLSLLSLDKDARWEDIRGLLFTVAETVRKGSFAYAMNGLCSLKQLSLMASPDVPINVQLFKSQLTILSEPQPFGFLLEGPPPSGGLHIGLTTTRGEDDPLPPRKDQTPDRIKITPYPSVTLNQLKDKETQRRKEIIAMEKIKAFEPLCKVPRTVLLDTDIGPDCDDVGALAVLIYYAKKYNFPIGGICNCTSNKAGNGVIDAICRRCGIDTPPLGQWHGEGFMDDQEYCKYNTAVAEAHSEAYRNGTLPVEDEVTYYRKRLAAAKDGEVMVISIGMFNNLAALLESPADEISPLTGMELVKAKVYALVSMAAILPQGRECNVICDYKAGEKVFANWPTPIYLSDFHIGVNVKTGYGHITDPEVIMADPLPMSYHLYTKEWNWEGAVKGQNASYDLTAVQFAALGICDLYDLDTPGDLEFYAEIPDLPDATRFIENPMGNKIFMKKKVTDEAIAHSLQEILNSF